MEELGKGIIEPEKQMKQDESGIRRVAAIVIEKVYPEINGGTFAAKCIAGDKFFVWADIFKDGHNIIRGSLRYRRKKSTAWKETPMRLLENDRWEGFFIPKENVRYLYTIEAWIDPLRSWIQDAKKKCLANLKLEDADLLEGLKWVKALEPKVKKRDKESLKKYFQQMELSQGAPEEILRIVEEPVFQKLVESYPVKQETTRYHRTLELIVDRKRAEFSAWYEFFPRSQGKRKQVSSTFKQCIQRLPDIKKMGFNVIYLPPIHPIGTTNRKGPNNTLTADKRSPGSPWAIGSFEGGHKSVHPDLGAIEDFENFVQAANDYGIEVAIDFAIQCSPDHPYVKQHPDWFYHLPDGSMRYAENPPKKYEDIYPIDFHCKDEIALWKELRSIILFWIEKGVKIFRVDNPHTKPLPFWEWLIDNVQTKFPEVLFLSEAFTRPKVMRYLAKAGFTQSYTYFTWRNSKWELQTYLEELTQSEMKEYFRPNFWANTPDILPRILQVGGKPAFKMRYVLAATLASNCGIYSGYEFCENVPLRENSEEYLNSEKYEIKVRDWNAPGNIKDFIARVNRIRSQNPALHHFKNIRFCHSHNDNILCYAKKTEDNSNIIVVVVNLDPFRVHEDTVSLPIWDFGLEHWQTYQVRDLLTGEKYYWKGSSNYVRLDPRNEPAHIFELRK